MISKNYYLVAFTLPETSIIISQIVLMEGNNDVV